MEFFFLGGATEPNIWDLVPKPKVQKKSPDICVVFMCIWKSDFIVKQTGWKILSLLMISNPNEIHETFKVCLLLSRSAFHEGVYDII